MNAIEFVKFGIVGFSGLFIDFLITWLFKEKLGVNKYLSNGFGFIIAVINNYFLNKYFTFQNNDSNFAAQFLCFLIISIIGFALNTTLLYVLQKNTKINFYFCKSIVTILVFFWNFSINSLYTFNT